MITKDQATSLIHGTQLFTDLDQNADGSPARWRVTGKCKVWKTRPEEFSVPLKHGMYTYGYLNQDNKEFFFLSEVDAASAMTPVQKKNLPLGLRRLTM